MAGFVQRVDGFQRRHRVIGFPLAVTYKFFDDQSNYLAATITYYSFAAIFPLLLISSSVLGFVLQGNRHLQREVLESALRQFPIVGTQLSTPQGLQGNAYAVLVGSITALYGILGLGQAAQNAVHTAYAIPRNSRPNPFLSRLHSGMFLALAGLAVIAVAMLSSLAANSSLVAGAVAGLVADVIAVMLTGVVLALLMRVATMRQQTFLQLLPGALVVGVLWQLLQKAGGAYVRHVVARASDVNAVFAVTLGLLALIYVASNMALVGVQINVVLGRRLWPRALLTPFTDSVLLTEGDQRAYASYAKAQRHKGFEVVTVDFDPEHTTGSIPALDERGRPRR